MRVRSSFTELRSNDPSDLSGARDGVVGVRYQTKFIDSMSYVGEFPSHGCLPVCVATCVRRCA